MLSSGSICPNCKSTDLSDDWTGILIILDPASSEMAKKMDIKEPGRYAIRVR